MFAPAASASVSFVRSWGSSGTGPGQFRAPQGITVDAAGDVWVADSNNNRIQHFDSQGNFINQWGSFGSSNTQFSAPHGVAVGPDGSVYVADTGNYRVQRFDRSGNFINGWPGDGTPAGAFNLPDGVAVGPDGSVYVSDGNNNRVQKFTADGAPILKWGSTGKGNDQFDSPFGIAVDGEGKVYVADASNLRVQQFTSTGTYLRTFARPQNSPVAAAIDASGNVFVVDAVQRRVDEYDARGKFLRAIGSNGSGPGQLDAPFGAAIRGSSLYVIENTNNRVSQFSVTPDPVLGRAMTAEVVSGTVLVRIPPSKTFVKLTDAGSLPVGTVVDAGQGTVRITATSGGKPYSSSFYQGAFQLAQARKKGATADLRLFGGSFKGCPRAARASAAAKKKSIRQLWGKGTGSFRTIGRFSAASVRGTTWLTDDQCTGTLTRVTQGAVTVRDLVRRTSVVVKAGQRYFARAK